MKSAFGLALFAAAVTAAPTEELMSDLPDAPAFDTTTYSGYLNTDVETKKLHYVFAESQSDPANDPIVIWFSGGPGCSSMLGFMQENGPRVIDDGEDYVKTNPYPWNQRANVLWIESPAGVGWSIAGTDADLDTDDVTQSEDAYAALLSWYAKFPEFLSNKLFVTGESYAGVYVPYLAWQIDQHNAAGAETQINLGGFMVGNGATNWDFDVWPSFPATVANFSIIPNSLYQKYLSSDCHAYFHNVYPATETEACKDVAKQLANLTIELNWYDLYRKNYDLAAASPRLGSTVIGGETRTYRRGMTMAEYTPWAAHILDSRSAHTRNGDYLSDYMNREDVRAAFNLDDSVPAWEMCSETLRYQVAEKASFWIYPELRNKYKLMFYSGDTDGAVPTYGTKQWIKELGWDVVEPWRQWLTNGTPSGYVEKYDGLDFVTVKGVGHMAPQWARQAVTEMMSAYIHDEDF